MMVVQGLHVLFGILWFGGAMFASFVVMPASKALEGGAKKTFNQSYAKHAIGFMTVSATLTLVFGILLGFFLHVWTRLGTSYGITFALALLIALILYFWGMLVLGPTAKKLEMQEDGSAEFIKLETRIKMFSFGEVGGFLLLFIVMVALRFSL